MNKNKDIKVMRTRNYATVVYLDSAPENWREILASHFVPCFISPLHNKDINPTGEPKKEHYHVLIMYDNVKTLEQAKELISSFNGVGCEVVNSIRGYARYLCHLDNPEKAQYSVDDVCSLCGADYNAIIGLATDKYKAIREMIAWCNSVGCQAYCDLLEYASVQRADWFRVLCDCGTVVMKEYLKSTSWKINVGVSSPLPPRVYKPHNINLTEIEGDNKINF